MLRERRASFAQSLFQPIVINYIFIIKLYNIYILMNIIYIYIYKFKIE